MSCVLRANFALPLRNPFYPSIDVIELIQLLKPSPWATIELFLKKLRVQTHYLKDPTTGEVRTQIKKIRGLAHMREPVLDNNKRQTVKNGRLLWLGKADTKPGNAEQLKFLRSSEGLISLKAYFARRKPSEVRCRFHAHDPSRPSYATCPSGLDSGLR